MKQSKFQIDKTKMVLTLMTLLVISFTTYKVAMLAAGITNAKEAIKFAYEHPELVNPVREQYETEVSAVQDSLVKRQSLIAPITVDEGDLGKE